MPPRSLRDRMKAGFSFSSLPIQQSAKCTFSRCLYSFSFLPVPLLNTDLFLSEEVFLSHLPLPWFPQQELFLKYPSVRHCCSAELQRLLRTPNSAVVGGTYSRMPWTWHTITCPLIKHWGVRGNNHSKVVFSCFTCICVVRLFKPKFNSQRRLSARPMQAAVTAPHSSSQQYSERLRKVLFSTVTWMPYQYHLSRALKADTQSPVELQRSLKMMPTPPGGLIGCYCTGLIFRETRHLQQPPVSLQYKL